MTISCHLHAAGLSSLKRRILLFLFLICFCPSLQAQTADSTQVSKRRLSTLAWGGGLGYAGLMAGLHVLWYSDHPQTSFHFFNDNQQWMQLDKAGHVYSAYQLGRIGTEAFRWTGMKPEKAAVLGSLSGWMFMLPMEIMDGFSEEYGASWGDLAANSLGSLLYGSQQLLWKESRIKPKFSFHTTSFAPLRPNTLGDNYPSQLLKDYNGQTYWLSADLYKFLPEETAFPKWLNLVVGYGTEEMIYAHTEQNIRSGFRPYAQFFIGPDIDLSHLQSRKKWVNILLFIIDGIRLPAPALELNKNSIRLHPVYF